MQARLREGTFVFLSVLRAAATATISSFPVQSICRAVRTGSVTVCDMPRLNVASIKIRL